MHVTQTLPDRFSMAARVFTVLLLSAPAAGAFDFWGLFETPPDDATATSATSATVAPGLDVAAGLREALEQGVSDAVSRLGRPGGFLNDKAVRIPVPEQVDIVARGLKMVGQQGLVDDFVAAMNHAAEQATPASAEVFLQTIQAMTLDDARSILAGGDTAATDVLRARGSESLATALYPIIDTAMQEVGVTQALSAVLRSGNMGGMMGPRAFDLTDYVTSRAMDGIFTKIAEEETRIRANPAARGSELLQAVFAGAAGKY